MNKCFRLACWVCRKLIPRLIWKRIKKIKSLYRCFSFAHWYSRVVAFTVWFVFSLSLFLSTRNGWVRLCDLQLESSKFTTKLLKSFWHYYGSFLCGVQVARLIQSARFVGFCCGCCRRQHEEGKTQNFELLEVLISNRWRLLINEKCVFDFIRHLFQIIFLFLFLFLLFPFCRSGDQCICFCYRCTFCFKAYVSSIWTWEHFEICVKCIQDSKSIVWMRTFP